MTAKLSRGKVWYPLSGQTGHLNVNLGGDYYWPQTGKRVNNTI